MILQTYLRKRQGSYEVNPETLAKIPPCNLGRVYNELSSPKYAGGRCNVGCTKSNKYLNHVKNISY